MQAPWFFPVSDVMLKKMSLYDLVTHLCIQSREFVLKFHQYKFSSNGCKHLGSHEMGLVYIFIIMVIIM